jgi:hypothetical protein
MRGTTFGQLRHAAADVTVAHDHRTESRLSSSIYRRRGAVGGADRLAGRSTNVDRIDGPDADSEWRKRLECVAGLDSDADPERIHLVESHRIAVDITDDSANSNAECYRIADALCVAKPDAPTHGCAKRDAARVVRHGHAAERKRRRAVRFATGLRFCRTRFGRHRDKWIVLEDRYGEQQQQRRNALSVGAKL